MSYESIPLPKPDSLEGSAPGSSVLIIGSGHSTRDLLKYKDKLRSHFDKIIACNHSFTAFDDVIDFHLVTEKTSKTSNNNVYKALCDGNYRTDVTRIVNWKGLELYPKKYKKIKATRTNFAGNPDIRHYKHNGKEGMLVGPVGKQNFSLGSVMLSAMHLSSMIGAKKIHIIGADMCFKDEFDHFYNDRVYRNRPKEFKKSNAHKIVKVSLNGIEYDTTEFFKESAQYIDSLIPTVFKEIDVYDFSKGLLTKPTKIDVDLFFNKG